jgi:deoxyribose-phosphate aldolase
MTEARLERNVENLNLILSLVDLTSLLQTDTRDRIATICDKLNKFEDNFKHSLPAAVCVYPNFVETVKTKLEKKEIEIAAVAGGFPDSQTFLSIKLAEVELAIEKGADEIDIVMPVGMFLEGKYEEIIKEISLIKSVMKDKKLKVIIESAALGGAENIYKASMISMEAGADFIKTSTGKSSGGASAEAVESMCQAIKDFKKETGKLVGFKASGGVRTVDSALEYIAIAKNILGEEFIKPETMRIGASSLYNEVLTELEGKEISYF